LKLIFRNEIRQKYGGWISRLETDDAVKGLYEIHLFTRSDDIKVDPKFSSLWEFMSNVLEVDAESVATGSMVEHLADPLFQQRFILDFPHVHNSDWSDAPDVGLETDSVFSVESVEDLV